MAIHQPSSSSSSSTTMLATTSPTSPTVRRRIRFAPLPDPRRSVLITDDGDELPIPAPDDELTQIPVSLLLPPPSPAPTKLKELSASESPPACSDERDSSGSSFLSSSSSTSASANSTPRTTTPSEYSPVSSVGSSPVTLNTALPLNNCPPLSSTSSNSSGSTPTPPNGSTSTHYSAPPSSWPKPRSLSILRPFKRSSNTVASSGSSSHSLTPTPSIDPPSTSPHARKAISPEEILTLGTINLFRTSSRESRTSTDSTLTATNSLWGFGRRTSPDSNSSTLFSGSSPLAKTQSAQSYNSNSKAKQSMFSFSSESSSSLSAVSADSKPRPAHKANSVPPVKTSTTGPKPANRYKGARMLNGRVYGSKRPSSLAANPFANARDEDEFVEWGYGGMGSVKGAKSAGVAGWEKLHGNVAAREKEGVGGAQDDEDDGSGMGWVRKRREERERKEREKLQQEKEKAEKEEAKEVGGSEEADRHVANPSISVSVEHTPEATLSPEAGGPDEMTSESKLSTPTPSRSSTVDGIVASLVVSEDLTEGPKSASRATLSPRPTLTSAPDSAATIVPALFVATTPTTAPETHEEKEEEDEGKEEKNTGQLREGYVFGNGSAQTQTRQEDAQVGSSGSALEHAQLEKEVEPEHVPVLVAIPVRPAHHHHSHSRHHRTVSFAKAAASGDEEEMKEDGQVMIEDVAADEITNGNGVPTANLYDEPKDIAEDTNARRASVSSTTSTSPSVSSTSEESESETDDEDRDEEEEEEEEELEGESRTARGAGVEKVSRHNRE